VAGKSDLEYVARLRGATCRAPEEHDGEILLGPIDLDLRTGEILAVVGPDGRSSGALVRMIAGLLPLSSGEIVGSTSVYGIVFDQPLLMDWRTAIENIVLIPELRRLDITAFRQRARRLLGLLGAAEYEDCRPAQLVPGVAERIALCRAIIHSPPLLLMDDPFRNLDPLRREGMWTDLQRLRGSEHFTALLTTSHLGEAVQLADQVAVMSHPPGRIIRTFDIDLPHPRRLDKATTPKIADLCGAIRTILQAEGVLP
jgi:NitT/TauT family transport system ATP-binding protein